MRCRACGRENREGARFCAECGAGLAAACAGCGAALAEGARFCDACGRAVAPAAPAREPRAYTPRHLAERVLGSRAALVGARKQVTVLFADVRGSMELAARVGGEDWHALLDRFFAILSAGVHRFEGTVNQYTGDGIMALFGAPLAHEDHAQRACLAALTLRAELRAYALELKRERGLEFAVRIGLNSGEVVVGRIGDDLRMDYTAQGPVVGLAARVQELADPGSICLAPATAQLAGGYFELADLGEFRVKGAEAPLRVHELRGPGRYATRFDASRARGLTRFVGRAAELAALDAALEQARAGNGQAMCVVAEPGTGKSRLCFEFAERCAARGVRVLRASALAHGQSLPLVPILALLRAWLGVGERDDAASARERIAGKLLLLDAALAPALPIVFELLGVADPARPAPSLDGPERESLLQAVLRHVVRGAGPEPVLVLVEDLHWLDATSANILELWVGALAGARGLLLSNFRPEFSAPWLERAHVQRIALQPLGPDALRELVRERIGDDPSVGAFAVEIAERAAGNPFFAEELIESAVELGVLGGVRGARRLAAGAPPLEVPASVQAVLAARIDRVPEREKLVLDTAAVIGREFAQALLGEIAELPPAELEGALAELARRDLVYARELWPEAQWAFKHPLTHEVALGAQLREARRGVHARVAAALARTVPDAPHEQAALVAQHFDAAGLALPAARWHRRAAEWEAPTDFPGSLRHWRRVRELLGTEPDSLEALGLAFLARARLVYYGAAQAGAWVETETLYTEARALAGRAGDPRGRAWLEVEYARTRAIALDDRDVSDARLREALALCEATGDADLCAYGRSFLCGNAWAIGDYDEAVELADALLAPGAARSANPYFSSRASGPLRASGMRAFSLYYLGRLDECQIELERTRALAAETGDRFGRVQAEHIAVLLIGLRGERARLADPVARAQAAVSDVRVVPTTRAYALATAGEALLQQGAFAEAARLLREAIELRPVTNARVRLAIDLALAQLGCRDAAGARTLCESAAAEARERGLRGVELFALLALSRVRRAQDGASAGDALDEILARASVLLGSTGARVYAPLLHEERAAQARLQSDGARAARELESARERYVELGAHAQLERLAREARA